MNIALLGYGNMGRRIEFLANERGFAVPLILTRENNENGKGITANSIKGIDVAIDFSQPESAKIHVEKLIGLGIPVVAGTTGWLDDQEFYEMLCRKHDGNLLYGSNFSLGVQLFIKLAARAGELFGNNSFFDAALNEIHHTNKTDAPSGTAKTLAKIWLEASGSTKKPLFLVPENHSVEPQDFLVTSQRIGSVFGEHQLRINSLYDDIELTHRARSRDAFAAGSLQAAQWLINQKPGFYLIEEVVEEVLTQ